jgi:hypothetical protein
MGGIIEQLSEVELARVVESLLCDSAEDRILVLNVQVFGGIDHRLLRVLKYAVKPAQYTQRKDYLAVFMRSIGTPQQIRDREDETGLLVMAGYRELQGAHVLNTYISALDILRPYAQIPITRLAL